MIILGINEPILEVSNNILNKSHVFIYFIVFENLLTLSLYL